ncbi:MAG: glycosyltransferase [Actinobacteria bacterium]|nr:glycosyltransferase [Actinomycetota bacterium]
MNLLFIHEVNWRDKVTFEIHDIPELLSIAGHSVFFIDYPEVPLDKKQSKYRYVRTTYSRVQSRTHIGSTVELRTPGRILPGVADRLVASLTFVPLLIKTVRSEKINLIVLYGVPTNGWQTVLVAKLLRIPVIFRAIDVSHLLRGSLFRNLIRTAERFIYRNVNHISVHNAALAEYCVSFGANPNNVSIDYPRFDTDRFRPSARDHELAKNYGIRPEQKVVFYRGTLYRFCGLEQFLELFAETLRNNENVLVLIIGSGEAEKDIYKTIHRELVRHICLADVSVNTFVPSLVTDCALPGRVLQSLACGISVVSTPLKGLVAYTGDSNSVVYASLDVEFVQAVNDLLHNKQKRDWLSVAGRELIASKGNWQDFTGEFVELCQSVLARK